MVPRAFNVTVGFSSFICCFMELAALMLALSLSSSSDRGLQRCKLALLCCAHFSVQPIHFKGLFLPWRKWSSLIHYEITAFVFYTLAGGSFGNL